MPEGFDPHKELERIDTLRDMMRACRDRTPKVLAILDNLLDTALKEPYINEEGEMLYPMSAKDQMALCEMITNRAYGRPIQQVRIADNSAKTESPVRIVLPDNGRSKFNMNGPVIDAA